MSDPTTNMWFQHFDKVITLGILGVGGVCGYFIRTFIDKRFKKEIIGYKNSLEQTNERLKHDLYKTVVNAELFIKRKHEIYPSLYEKIAIALGETQAIERSGLAMAGFEGFSENEIKEMIDGLFIPEEFKDQIAKETLEDKNKGFEKYNEHLPLHLSNRAKESIRKSINEWRKAELYFSEEVNQTIHSIFGSLNGYVNRFSLKLNPHYSALGEPDYKKLDEAEDKIQKLKEAMWKEMQN